MAGLGQNLHHIIPKESNCNMSFYLDIVVLKEEMEKADLEEQLVEWGGQKFSQDPVKYLGRKSLVFEQLTSLVYHCKLIGDDLDEQKYCALVFKGEELSELEFLVNDPKSDLRSNSLFLFLEKLISLSSFYVFLTREDEGIKERYEINDEEDFRDVLCKSLSWDTPKDILMVMNDV